MTAATSAPILRVMVAALSLGAAAAGCKNTGIKPAVEAGAPDVAAGTDDRDAASAWCHEIFPETVASLDTGTDASTCEQDARRKLRAMEVGCSCLPVGVDDHLRCVYYVARFDDQGRIAAIDPPAGPPPLDQAAYTRCLRESHPPDTWPCLSRQTILFRAQICTLP